MRLRLMLAALPLMTLAVEAADVKATSKIDQVTVFPNGAEVTRLARVKLEKGEHVIYLTDITARALPSSIRVEGKAVGRLEIGSVDSRITFVARAEAANPGDRKQIEDSIEKLRDERAALQAAVDAAQAQKTLITNLSQLPSQQAPAGATQPMQPDWGQLFTLIGQRHAEAQKAILETQLKIREVDRQIKDLEGKLGSLAPRQEERTEVKIFVAADVALEAELTVRYQVGNASWTPYYDARLVSGTKAQAPKLTLERRASIQQRSGESWDNVALALSTTRPGTGTAAPDLPVLTVDYEPDLPRPALVTAQPQAQRAMAAPRSKTASESDADGVRPDEAKAAQEQRATIDAQAFQAVYGIPGRITIPATGEAKRVQIDAADIEPSLAVRTVPKRDAKAYLYAKAVFAKGTPILPGVVSLFRDGTFVGNGRLPQLAPGEEHELGFGIDDAVRVRYAVVEEKRGETGVLTTSKTDVRNFKISIRNLHERAIAVSVVDQQPVSNNQDIKVELTGRTAPTRRDMEDKRGLLAWDFKLEPDEEKVIEFGYRTVWPGAKKIQYN